MARFNRSARNGPAAISALKVSGFLVPRFWVALDLLMIEVLSETTHQKLSTMPSLEKLLTQLEESKRNFGEDGKPVITAIAVEPVPEGEAGRVEPTRHEEVEEKRAGKGYNQSRRVGSSEDRYSDQGRDKYR